MRKRPLASTLGCRDIDNEGDEIKGEEGDAETTVVKENAIPTRKSTVKKRAIKKKLQFSDSELEESSQDDFEPDETSPTPSRRRRTELTFTESALATAVRTPPATRAMRKSLRTEPASPYRVPSVCSGTVDLQPSIGHRPSEFSYGDILHQFCVQGYDEPLLGRREPVMSNPVAAIPDIVKRGGTPRVSAKEIQRRIQEKTLKRVQENNLTKVQEESLNNNAAQRVSHERVNEIELQTDMMEKKAEEDAYPYTVRAFVETEAAKHRDDVAMDEDENKALFNAMEGAALVWGKQTYNKLDPATQRMVQPGLRMRLDRIDGTYKIELGKLMAERAARVLQDLAGDGDTQYLPSPWLE
jgi:hypothetical protein